MILSHENMYKRHYSVEYYGSENKISFKGDMKVKSTIMYDEIVDFILSSAYKAHGTLLIDLTKLTLIDLAGISFLSVFLIKMKTTNLKIKIIVAKYSKLHQLTISDLQKINDNVELEYLVLH